MTESGDFDMQEQGPAPKPGLPSKPVLEMALNVDKFKDEVK